MPVTTLVVLTKDNTKTLPVAHATPVATVSAGGLNIKSLTATQQIGDMSQGAVNLLDPFNGTTLNPGWSQSIDDSTTSAPLPTVTGGNLFGNYSGSTSIVWSGSRFGADQAVVVNIAAKPTVSSTNIHMGVRISGATTLNGLNGYQCYLRHVSAGSDTWEFGKRVAGVYTLLAGGSLTWATTDNFEFRAVGNLLSLYRQASGSGAWTFVGSVTDSTYSAEGRVNVGGVGIEWKVGSISAGNLPYVPFTKRDNTTLTTSVRASAFPAGTLTLLATSPVLASLQMLINKAIILNETTFPQVFKAATHTFPVATTPTSATVTHPSSTNIKTLLATNTLLASVANSKAVIITAGYNIILPPGFQGTGTNVTVGRVLGHSSAGNILAQTTPLASKTLRLAFTRQATQGNLAFLTSQFLQQLKTKSVLATQAQTATLTKLARIGVTAVEHVQTVFVSGRSYVISPAIQTNAAFLTYTTEQGVPVLILTPTGPGGLSLVVSVVPDGTLILTPIS